MNYFKAICLISVFFLSTGCDNPYVKNKTPAANITQKTIPSKSTTKKLQRKSLLLKLLTMLLFTILATLNTASSKMNF